MNSTNADGYVDDHNFGPFLKRPNDTTFDFTLLFEDVILSILPSSLLLFLIPPRVLFLRKASRKVVTSWLGAAKIALIVLFTILQIVNIVFTSQSWLRTQASLAAAVLALVAALGLCVLSYFEHIKSVQPSSIMDAYLILTLPFDGARLRTRSLRGDAAGTGIASALLFVKALILFFETLTKRHILLAPYVSTSPETTGGMFSRILFWWLNPLFRQGYKGVVNAKDLFTIDRDLLSGTLQTAFLRRWNGRNKYPKNHTLAWVMLHMMQTPFLAAVFPRLALIFFKFMQPLLISSIINLVSDDGSESADDRGYGLIAATGLVYVGLALAGTFYQHKANRMATMVRGALINAIYTQTLNLSTYGYDESAAVTLMSSDVERICEALLPVHNIWSSPLEFTLAIWLLHREIGIALLGPLFIVACATTGPFFISGGMKAAQRNWIEGIQSRIDTTAKVLPAIRGIRMLGLSTKVSSIVRQLRLEEVSRSLRMRKLSVAMIALGNTSDILVPGAAFTVYVIVASINGQTLDVTSAFTALSLIQLLVTPISALIFTLPPLVAAIGCFDRIEAFITSPARQDYRTFAPPVTQNGYQFQETTTVKYTYDKSDNPPAEKPIDDETQTLLQAVEVENLTLSWADNQEPVIRDMSLKIMAGSLNMVVGPVGCGKSSLLQGLLGEMPTPSGHVYLDRVHIGFVDQASWIRNASIRDNIIGILPWEPEWYTQVLHACALDAEIANLAERDLTNAGSAGAALSGGQKLRVALARAVYSRSQILMLDDVFSGLDAVNEELIFSRLLGKDGLLRDQGTTVIAVTHAAHRLPFADHIIAFSEEGTVAEQGTFTELVANGRYVAELAARHVKEEVLDAHDEAKPIEKPAASDEEAERLNAMEDIHRPVGDRSLYKYYALAVGPRKAMFWMSLMFCYAALLRFPDLWIKFWTQAIASRGNSVNGFYLGILLAAEVAALMMLVAVGSLLLVVMVPRSAIYLHEKLLETVTSAPFAFFTKTDVGQIVNRFSQDLSVVDMELPVAALILASSVCTVLLQAVLICISAAYFATVMPFLLLQMWILQKFYLRTSRQIRLMDLEAKAPLYSNFIETLNGLVTIRALGWTESMSEKNMVLLDNSQKPFYLLYCIQRWLALVLDLMVAALAVILVGLIVKFRQTADAGFVGVALVNIMDFSMSLSDVIKGWTAVETSLGAISRIKSFTQDTGSENLAQESQPVPPDWPSKGEIIISNVSASYTAEQQPPTLHNLNLTIAPGSKVGICGSSGAGKSSFIALLSHMLEIQSGSIHIDGVDISTIPRQQLRERITVITQEPVFLKGTIRENLNCFSDDNDNQPLTSPLQAPTTTTTTTTKTSTPIDSQPPSTREETALRKVGLYDSIISGLSSTSSSPSSTTTTNQNLNTPLSNPSTLLSHGQKQLFSLARALLTQSKIIVLDEATASVDVATEQKMMDVIRDEFAACTVISVAHRLGTIVGCDVVVVMEGGEVVEVGVPRELLEVEGGRFRALWECQGRGGGGGGGRTT